MPPASASVAHPGLQGTPNCRQINVEEGGKNPLQQIKGLKGLISKEKLKELDVSGLTKHQPGAGSRVGELDGEAQCPGNCTPPGAAFQGIISRRKDQRQVSSVNTAPSSFGYHPLVSVAGSVGVQPEMKFCTPRDLSGPATDSFNEAARFVAG